MEPACVDDAAIACRVGTPGKRNRLIPPRPDPATHGGEKATGWICDERYFWHDTRSAAASCPPAASSSPSRTPTARRQATLSQHLLEVSGLLEQLCPSPRRPRKRCSLPPRRVRQPDRGALRRERRRRGRADTVQAGSCEIALLAAGGVITAIDAVLDGTVDNVYALTSPPGHHAEPDQGRGFCIFANAAIGAARARLEASSGLRSSTGTSTTATAPRRSSTTTRPFSRSCHPGQLLPAGLGPPARDRRGRRRGLLPQHPTSGGLGRRAYVEAYERVVAPALRGFRRSS